MKSSMRMDVVSEGENVERNPIYGKTLGVKDSLIFKGVKEENQSENRTLGSLRS